MTALAQAIARRREELGWSLTRLATAAGCSKAYLSEIENRRHANPPSRRLVEAIEAAMEMGRGELTRLADWESTPTEIRRDYQRLQDQLERLAGRRQDGTLNLDGLYQAGALQRYAEGAGGNLQPMALQPGGVPLINKVAAGYPSDFTDLDYPARIADEYIHAPSVNDPQAFAARVVGRSMLPEYREGDVVIFSPARCAADGSDCFVRLLPDHQTTFKRVYFQGEGRVRLEPLNPDFEPRVVELAQVDGLYPAVWRMSAIG